MKTILVSLFLFFLCSINSTAQNPNLISNGNFQSLKSWKSNNNLNNAAKVTLLPKENGVTIYNPVIDLDGSLYQDISTKGYEWFSYSLRIKREGILRASIGFVALDKSGKFLKIFTPRPVVTGNTWRSYSGKINVPEGTKTLRVLLSVLGGSCSFSDITVERAEGPENNNVTRKNITNKGFSVDSYLVDRPFWELRCDDLDGDGIPEIIGCDVDGIVTVRHEGSPAFFTYAAPALVYQFETADLNNDGKKEILMSFVDPKYKVRAIDLSGRTVCEFRGPSSHERIATGNLNNNADPMVGVSKNNGIAGSGIAGGIILYNRKGEMLWQKDEKLREFHFGQVQPNSDKEQLIVGGPGLEFRIYDLQGNLLGSSNFSTPGEVLDHFIVTDIDNDGASEIVATSTYENTLTIRCIKEGKIIWENNLPGVTDQDVSGMNIAIGDFDKTLPGLETILVGPLDIFLFDAKGSLIYENNRLNIAQDEYYWWKRFADRGINSLDIAFYDERNPHLYLSSSRFRHNAYYNLNYGKKDHFGSYLVPDQEAHLENIYNTLKKLPANSSPSNKKLKVFMALREFAVAPESTLRQWKEVLSKMETPNLEYLVMYEASDLYGNKRGYKMTTEQIVERAKLFEKVGIPFGYFTTHFGQVWLSEEAIKRSKEVAPNTFRFIYVAENLVSLYLPPYYTDFLKWTSKTLEFCKQHGMKMIFKEKHDAWGLLPADKEVSDMLFNPEYKDVTVPIWSTNQPYQPEIQLGGMLGLKAAGFCNEFGMSTQFWNWHEWGRYPRGIRDVTPTFVCPSDIMLRLDLMGIALGGTWIHIEGGQPYLFADISKGLAPLANRHRDLAYELVRKNILLPGAVPENVSKTSLIRYLHSDMKKAKAEKEQVAQPYYNRKNTGSLRKGFIPARHIFETYSPDAFPWLAYSQAWNVTTCFPTTPYGWIPVLPPTAKLSNDQYSIITDGEKVLVDGKWKESQEVSSGVQKTIEKGAEEIPIEAPGTCLIIQKDAIKEKVYTVIMIDPGYLAPRGVSTTILSRKGKILKATDMVSGESLRFRGNSCSLTILPGAFRIVKIELAEK